jgi:hypothetical protein
MRKQSTRSRMQEIHQMQSPHWGSDSHKPSAERQEDNLNMDWVLNYVKESSVFISCDNNIAVIQNT